MRIKQADAVVGDVGRSFEITTNDDLSGLELADLELVFVKPDGGTFTRTPTSKTTYTVTYVSVDGDLDQYGDWYLFMRNLFTGFEYSAGQNAFSVRPKAEEMAMY